ncbi:MAG: helix-turn-helix domain-containing protein [Leptospiraceae bacterium]|nr:helix-turn-helix domain-containing protein [Leptospiraceae bacterium]
MVIFKVKDLIHQCPFELSLAILSGKWKSVILFKLMKVQMMRYGDLKKLLPQISHKVLSNELKELEEFGIIIRKAFAESPPRVCYSLTKKGEKLRPIFGLMRKWGMSYKVVIEDDPNSKFKKAKIISENSK